MVYLPTYVTLIMKPKLGSEELNVEYLMKQTINNKKETKKKQIFFLIGNKRENRNKNELTLLNIRQQFSPPNFLVSIVVKLSFTIQLQTKLPIRRIFRRRSAGYRIARDRRSGISSDDSGQKKCRGFTLLDRKGIVN